MLRIICNLIVYCVVLAFVAPVSATTIKIAPNADNWISSCSSGALVNNGSMDQLRVRTSWWGPSGSKEPKNFRSILGFDIGGLPGDSNLVTQASIGLYYFNVPNGHADPVGRTYDLHGLTNTWTEMGSTWQARDDYDQASPLYWDSYNAGTPSYQPGGADSSSAVIASAVVPASTNNWMTWDVTGLVKDWIDGNVSNCGVLVKDANEIESDPGGGNISYHAQFRGREFSNATFRPFLEVTYVPEPASLMLLGIGFVALSATRRRRA